MNTVLIYVSVLLGAGILLLKFKGQFGKKTAEDISQHKYGLTLCV
jgi:hypothetical protein